MKRKKPRIKIAIADDHKVVRDSICFCVELYAREKYEVMINVDDANILFEKMRENCPDVVILDLQMPNMNGENTCREMRKEFPGIKIIIFTFHRGWAEADMLIRAGARGFITKDYGYEKIFEAVDEVVKGRVYLCNPAINYYQNIPEPKKFRMMHREKKILRLLAKGHRTRDIAVELGFSCRTVELVKTNLFRKTNTKNAVELINYVRGVGW